MSSSREMKAGFIARLFCLSVLAGSATAQIPNQVLVFGKNSGNSDQVLRFDGKLAFLGATTVTGTGSLNDTTGLSFDSSGCTTLTHDSLGPTQLVRMNADGTLMPPVQLSHNPNFLVVTREGFVLSLSRIPLLSPGPVYGVTPQGGIDWVNWDGSEEYAWYPQDMAVTTEGEVWIGGRTPLQSSFWARSLLQRVDPDTGSCVQSFLLPDLTEGTGDEYCYALAGSVDGTIWLQHGGPASSAPYTLDQTDGEQILQTLLLLKGAQNGSHRIRVDGSGKLYVVGVLNIGETSGKYLHRYDPANPAEPEATYGLGGVILAFALGSGGDEAYAITFPTGSPSGTRKLIRLNLVTGVSSSFPVGPAYFNPTLSNGDPTGFIYANVVDRAGDNDGDGAANGVETAARSSPFDALSRPDGPKVRISFAQSNGALILKFVDPDGLLDPTGGLNLASLSLTSSQHGQIFQYMLSFLTFVQVSPDGTEVTALFGGLPLAPDLKWKLEARVADKTGAVGWDWQVSPPGDL